MERWISRVVSALLSLVLFRPILATAQAPSAPAPAAATAPDGGAPAAPALPPGTYRGFPLSPPEAASIPSPDKDTFSLPQHMQAALAQAQDYLTKNGAGSERGASDIVNGAFDGLRHGIARNAYKLGWREASHVSITPGEPRQVFWKPNGATLQVVAVVVKGGTVSFHPSISATPGWADLNYTFSELPAPAMAGTDFPLCVKATGKPQHSGTTWSQACAKDDPNLSQLQLVRLFGWNVVKTDSKGKPVLFQKAGRFAEFAQDAANKVKVTLVSKQAASKLAAQYPALPDGVLTHPLSATALVFKGRHLPGPYRVELREGKVVAVAKGGTGTLWDPPDAAKASAEVVFDRMAGPAYWPTLRVVASNAQVYDLRTSDNSPEKLLGLITKVVGDKATTPEAKIGGLRKLPGGWERVPDEALQELIANWK